MATCNCACMHSVTLELEWDSLLALVIDHVTIAAAVATIMNASNAIPRRLLVVTLATLDPLSEVHPFRTWCRRWESCEEAQLLLLGASRRSAKGISQVDPIDSGGPT